MCSGCAVYHESSLSCVLTCLFCTIQCGIEERTKTQECKLRNLKVPSKFKTLKTLSCKNHLSHPIYTKRKKQCSFVTVEISFLTLQTVKLMWWMKRLPWDQSSLAVEDMSAVWFHLYIRRWSTAASFEVTCRIHLEGGSESKRETWRVFVSVYES